MNRLVFLYLYQILLCKGAQIYIIHLINTVRHFSARRFGRYAQRKMPTDAVFGNTII